MKNIKTCPFCGGEAKLMMVTDAGNYQVYCKKCSVNVGRYWFYKKEEAIEAWNKRKPMDEIVERLEELRTYEKEGQCPKHDKCSKEPYECTSCYTTTAIEIVKGGIE